MPKRMICWPPGIGLGELVELAQGWPAILGLAAMASVPPPTLARHPICTGSLLTRSTSVSPVERGGPSVSFRSMTRRPEWRLICFGPMRRNASYKPDSTAGSSLRWARVASTCIPCCGRSFSRNLRRSAQKLSARSFLVRSTISSDTSCGMKHSVSRNAQIRLSRSSALSRLRRDGFLQTVGQQLAYLAWARA